MGDGLPKLAVPSISIGLISRVCGSRSGFPISGISTKVRHRSNEFHAAKPLLTGFCGCHVGSSTPVESRLVEMRCWCPRRQLSLVRCGTGQHLWWGFWLGYSTMVRCQWSAGRCPTRKYDARNPWGCVGLELVTLLFELQRVELRCMHTSYLSIIYRYKYSSTIKLFWVFLEEYFSLLRACRHFWWSSKPLLFARPEASGDNQVWNDPTLRSFAVV